MAALDDLINKIDNPELKLQMQHVVRKLLKQKKFGLVFEDHLPESTILQEREVRVGLTVTYKSEPLKERFFVRAINNDIAECISLNDTTLTRAIPIGDLVPFATFGEPIYPYLQVQDTISTAPDSPLWHSLIQTTITMHYNCLPIYIPAMFTAYLSTRPITLALTIGNTTMTM